MAGTHIRSQSTIRGHNVTIHRARQLVLSSEPKSHFPFSSVFLMDTPHPSADGRDLSTTLGLIEAQPSSHGRTQSSAMVSAAHAPSSIHGPREIVDDVGPDGPGGATPFIDSCPDSVDDPGLVGAWSGLDTGDGSFGIDGSGCLRSVHPSAGLDGGKFGDGRVADDDSGFAERSPWTPNSSSNSSPKSSTRLSNIVIAFWGMCTTSTTASRFSAPRQRSR